MARNTKKLQNRILSVLRGQGNGEVLAISGSDPKRKLGDLVGNFNRSDFIEALDVLKRRGKIVVTDDRIALTKTPFDRSEMGPQQRSESCYATDSTGRHLPSVLRDDMVGELTVSKLETKEVTDLSIQETIVITAKNLHEYLTLALWAVYEAAIEDKFVGSLTGLLCEKLSITKNQAGRLVHELKRVGAISQKLVGYHKWETKVLVDGNTTIARSSDGELKVQGQMQADDSEDHDEHDGHDDIVRLQAETIAVLQTARVDLERRLTEQEEEITRLRRKNEALANDLQASTTRIKELESVSDARHDYAKYLRQLKSDLSR